MASPAGSVTIAPRGREARHAVAVRDARRGPRRGRGSGGRMVAPRDARVAARAQRAVPVPARGAGRGAHRPGEPAVAAGRGAVGRGRRPGGAGGRPPACPYLLVDAGFADPLRWRQPAAVGVGDTGQAAYTTFFTVPGATEAARLGVT